MIEQTNGPTNMDALSRFASGSRTSAKYRLQVFFYRSNCQTGHSEKTAWKHGFADCRPNRAFICKKNSTSPIASSRFLIKDLEGTDCKWIRPRKRHIRPCCHSFLPRRFPICLLISINLSSVAYFSPRPPSSVSWYPLRPFARKNVDSPCCWRYGGAVKFSGRGESPHRR